MSKNALVLFGALVGLVTGCILFPEMALISFVGISVITGWFIGHQSIKN